MLHTQENEARDKEIDQLLQAFLCGQWQRKNYLGSSFVIQQTNLDPSSFFLPHPRPRRRSWRLMHQEDESILHFYILFLASVHSFSHKSTQISFPSSLDFESGGKQQDRLKNLFRWWGSNFSNSIKLFNWIGHTCISNVEAQCRYVVCITAGFHVTCSTSYSLRLRTKAIDCQSNFFHVLSTSTDVMLFLIAISRDRLKTTNKLP